MTFMSQSAFLQTFATLRADRKLSSMDWVPSDARELFVLSSNFTRGFLHPAILSRDDTTSFLLEYIAKSNAATLETIKGLFTVFADHADLSLTVNRHILKISDNVVKVGILIL